MKIMYGDGGIRVTVVKHSVNIWGDELLTYQLRYPRFIHSEFMTHRMLSRNAASSRAIPVSAQLEQIEKNPAMPVHWGLNKPGMQATKKEGDVKKGKWLWQLAVEEIVKICETLWDDGNGFHKQVVNRLNEPFQFMDVIASATDWDNFFWLRCHEDADPTIKELADVMQAAKRASEPTLLRHGEWHTPFVDSFRDGTTGKLIYESSGKEISVEDAIVISTSCCAQVSYRKLDTSLKKAIALYERLIGGERIHASPFEHIAQPFGEDEQMARKRAQRLFVYDMGQSGIEGLEDFYKKDSQQFLYSGNFKGWHQSRKYLDNENYKR